MADEARCAEKAVGLCLWARARGDESQRLLPAQTFPELDSSIGARLQLADTFQAINELKQSLRVAAASRHLALRNAAVLTTAAGMSF